MKLHGAFAVALLGAATGWAQVSATIETDPVPSPGTANGARIWVNPLDTSQSLVFTPDRTSALFSYGLDGHLVQQISSIPFGVDLHAQFPLAGTRVTLVAVANQATSGIDFYVADPTTHRLTLINTVLMPGGTPPLRGVALYEDPAGSFFAFVLTQTGQVSQLQIQDNGTGRLSGQIVRTLSVSSVADDAIADDVSGALYVSETGVGIWRFAAGADAGTTPKLVDSVDGGTVQGLALFVPQGGTGFLLASFPSLGTFKVYDRATNAALGSFPVVPDGGIEGCRGTKGIAATSVGLGAGFPQGLFVCEDSFNDLNQNLKYVPWSSVAAALGLVSADGGSPDGGAADGGSGGPHGSGGGGPPPSGGFPPGPPPPGHCGCTAGAAPLWVGLLALAAWSRRRRAG